MHKRIPGPVRPAALAVMLAIVAGCGGAARAPREATAVVVVRTAAVRDTLLSRPILASGLLAADEEVPLSFKVGGVVERITVEEGQAVRAGQLLASLEPSEIAAFVDKAQAALDKAERDLARARTLFAASVISRASLDDAETARDAAAADVRAARFNERHSTLVAPGAGVVLRRTAEPGQITAAGQQVLLFGRQGRGQRVRVGLADRDAARVVVGDDVEATFDAHPGRIFRGRVERVGAAATAATGTYEVVIRLAAPVGVGAVGLASGLVADVTIRPAAAESLRVIPIQALLEGDGDGGMVWSPSAGGGVTRHSVRLASFDGGAVAVREGLEGVSRVITDGSAYLSESSRIRLADGTANPIGPGDPERPGR